MPRKVIESKITFKQVTSNPKETELRIKKTYDKIFSLAYSNLKKKQNEAKDKTTTLHTK